MVVDVRFYLSLTSYKHLSTAAEIQGEQQKCVLIRGVSMLWLIAVMVGLDLRRGISDHTLLCMFVYVPTKAHALDLHQRFQCWLEGKKQWFSL